MSRIRKATITAGFGYAHFALALLTGIVLVPVTLGHLGARSWGLWLATGELLGYAAMVDLGMLGVLPWMIAEADGRGNRAAIRRLIVQGVLVGAGVGLAYALIAFALWTVLPSVLRFNVADRALIGPPLALLVAGHAVVYPLRVFRAVLGGLQDAFFNGVLAIVQSMLTVALTAVLLTKGYGLYALALASVLPALAVFAASAIRTAVLAPDLFSGWTMPYASELRLLLTNGAGVWLGNIGWQLLAASTALVITFLGYPEWVPVYSCTAKLSMLGAQLAWVLPDSGLVGLAQVSGEGRSQRRLRDVVLMMLRLHLLLSGGAALVLLAWNPSFVTAWVGSDLFGGVRLNVLLAAGVVLYSVVHGLVTTASVLGNRLQVGIVALVNGVLQTALAIVFGRMWGINGIAVAGLIAALITSVPAGALLLESRTGLTGAQLARELIAPWFARTAGLLAVAAAVGVFYQRIGIVTSAALTAAILAVYVWNTRTIYSALPLPPPLGEWLVRLRVVPSADMRPAPAAVALGADEA